MPDPAPLARSTLDRAGHRRTDPEWLAEAWPRARVLVIERGRALVAGGRLVLIPADRAPAGDRLFLGVDTDGVPHFAVVARLSQVETPEGAERAGVREVGHLLDPFDAGLLMAAAAVANFHRSHPYHPRSGKATTMGDGGWVRKDDGGEQVWPRTDPAVIALVHDGEPGAAGRCLLGQNAAWLRAGGSGPPRFSCLAGFVEPGESAEQTVVREVAEEVGVPVGDLTYIGSQAWPYPGSLMLGFHAIADPAAPIRVDPTEIASARWFTRTEIAGADAGEDVGFAISPPSSIAHHLIMVWLHG